MRQSGERRNGEGQKTIWTIGYGNLAPDDFVKKLKEAEVTLVFDVRRFGTKGRLRCYDMDTDVAVSRHKGIGDLLYKARIVYSCIGWKLANNYETLEEYKGWLTCQRAQSEIEELADAVGWWSSKHDIALLCAEGDPFEKDGVTPRCHRVYVAEALMKQLGDGWKTEHL